MTNEPDKELNSRVNQVSRSLWRIARKPLRWAGIGALTVAGISILLDGASSLTDIEDDIARIGDLEYIPYPEKGECIYTNPYFNKKVDYSGLKEGLFLSITKAALPFVSADEGYQGDFVGKIPIYGTEKCDALDANLVTIFKTRADAIAEQQKNAKEIAVRLRELQAEYPKYQLVNYY